MWESFSDFEVLDVRSSHQHMNAPEGLQTFQINMCNVEVALRRKINLEGCSLLEIKCLKSASK